MMTKLEELENRIRSLEKQLIGQMAPVGPYIPAPYQPKTPSDPWGVRQPTVHLWNKLR